MCKLRPSLSCGRRRDYINSVLLRSLDKGGGVRCQGELLHGESEDSQGSKCTCELEQEAKLGKRGSSFSYDMMM